MFNNHIKGTNTMHVARQAMKNICFPQIENSFSNYNNTTCSNNKVKNFANKQLLTK